MNRTRKIDLPEGLIIQTIMDNSYDTIYFKDSNSKFLLNSKAHAMQFGEVDPANMVGKSDFDYFPEAFAQQSYSVEQLIMKTKQPIIGIVEKWERPGKTPIWFSASKYPLLDDVGNVIGTWGTSRDVSDFKENELMLEELNMQLLEANRRLEILSIRDDLSDLYNHRHFFDQLNMEIAHVKKNSLNGDNRNFSILLIDLDNFKCINDMHGHLTGDIVIKSIGSKLLQLTNLTDTCFRYGGDEFAVILSDTDLDSAYIYAESIRKTISEMAIFTDQAKLTLTVSIGVASSIEKESITELVQLADTRLYQAKAAGRNCLRR